MTHKKTLLCIVLFFMSFMCYAQRTANVAALGKTQKPAYPVIGYHWVLEVSESKQHYHVIVVTLQQNRLEDRRPLDRYDAAAWSAIGALSDASAKLVDMYFKYEKIEAPKLEKWKNADILTNQIRLKEMLTLGKDSIKNLKGNQFDQ